MIPFKSKGSESRRSSILKPRKPRQPLQNVNFDSSSNENSPTTSKIKRRVSFAEKKHVKEFCHSTEQGTVWDNTYEEHDFSLKGSFVVDQNTQVESKENASLCASNKDRMHIHSKSNSSNYPNNDYLLNNQLSQEPVTRVNKEDDDTSCDLDFVNAIKSTELSNTQLGYVTLPNKSYVSKDVISNGIVAYSDTDEECMELLDGKSQSRQTVKTNIAHTSKNIKSSNITIYRDSDEEGNVASKYYSKSSCSNVNSELDKTNSQDLSMELTTSIPISLSSSYAEEQKEQKLNNINNLNTNYATNCDNVSMDITAVPIFAKSVASDLGISEQMPIILQNYENTKWDANTHNATNVNYANDSMVLTSLIQPLTDVIGTDISHTNNTTFDTSMELINVSSKIHEKNVCNENILKKNDLRKNQTDKTEIFNDVLMEMTKPVSAILSSSVYNKENFRMDEPISKDDRTTFFHNVSMEMTKTVSTKNKQEIVDINTCKSLSEKNTHDGKDVNISTCFNEGTRMLCKSMEFTDTVPSPLYYEKMFHDAQDAQSVNKSTCEDYKNDRTEFFNNASMDITKSVNMLPLNIDKENLKIDGSMSKNNKTMIFHNISMEMTTAVSSRKRDEITQSITCKLTSKENTYEKEMNNSTCLNEGTRLLCKSMELTEAVPISLHERTFNTSQTTQATLSQSLSKNSLSTENSMGIAFQTDVANKTIQDMSMEITAVVPSTLQLMQDVNKTENLIISENDEFQHLMTNNNLANSNKRTTKEDFTISRRVETENIKHNELSNVVVIQSPLDNLGHSLNANFESSSGKKRIFDANERSYPKRVRNSFMEVQSPQKNDIHSFPSANVNCVNDIERNECFVKNIMDHTQISDSNLKDNPNEISDHSFLRKSLPYLDNSLVELQSIKPPSFVSLDSEEENSFPEIQHELQSSIITDISINNTSNRLIINNVIESKCLKEKLINTDDKAEDCCSSTIIDKIEDNQETNCQTITKTIINDSRSNKSNYYTTKNVNEESISSVNVKNGKAVTVQDVNHYTSLIIKEIEVTDKDQVSEKEHTRKKINEDAKLQNDIKQKEQYLNEKYLNEKEKIEKFNDHFEDVEVDIEDQIDSEECRKSLNEVKQQSMEQQDECATKKITTTQYNSTIEDVKNESLIEQDPFLTLSQKLEMHAAREDCIWNVYYKNIDKKMIVFSFMSNSLLIATFLSYDFKGSKEDLIKEIKIISRISDNAGVLIRVAHKLILEKINTKILTKLYKTHQDILPMLNCISQDVKLTMDFMFDLKRLDDLNLMEIARDKISFVSRSKRMDIILRVTIKVKQFDKLTSNDISLCCLLGTVKETDIKNLIKNVKRDHKFLRRYMNDVKDYIDIIEETFK